MKMTRSVLMALEPLIRSWIKAFKKYSINNFISTQKDFNHLRVRYVLESFIFLNGEKIECYIYVWI